MFLFCVFMIFCSNKINSEHWILSLKENKEIITTCVCMFKCLVHNGHNVLKNTTNN